MDIDELHLNKKILLSAFILGAILSFFTNDFILEFPYIKEGMGIGLILGILWLPVRYKSDGLEGIDIAKKDFGTSIIYTFSFIAGFFIFFGIKKLILFLL